MFLITVTNGIAKFISIDFNFTVTSDTVSVISKIDFIGRSEIDSLLLKENKDNYQYSYVNFGYHLIGTQKLNSTLFFDDELKNYYEFNFTYIIDDNSFFNIYIINFQRKKIIIKSGQTKYYEGTGEIITILVEKNNVVVT